MLAVYSASQDLHLAFSRVVLTHDGMEKCVHDFLCCWPMPLSPCSVTASPIYTHDHIHRRDCGKHMGVRETHLQTISTGTSPDGSSNLCSCAKAQENTFNTVSCRVPRQRILI